MIRQTELELRQQRLLRRSAALRASIAEQSAVFETPFAVADRIHAGARWAWRERVALIGGATVVMIVLRPRRIWKLAGLALWVWRRKRRLRRWLTAAGIAPPPGAPAPRGASVAP